MFIRDESGVAGLGESAKGVADGLERSRQIRSENMARELALRELELREQQVSAQLDNWAQTSKQRKEALDFERYRFGVQTKEREKAFGAAQAERDRAFGLQNQRFKYIKDKDAAAVEREMARAQGLSLLARATEDGEFDSDDIAQLDDFRDTVTDPVVLAEIDTRVSEFNQRRLAAEKRESERQLQSNIDFLLSIQDEDIVADLEMARVEAHNANDRGILERKVNDLIQQRAQMHRRERKLAQFISDKQQELATPAVTSRMDNEDRYLAHELLAELQFLAERNPHDPKIKDIETDLRVTMMDPESRKERADNIERLAELEAFSQPFRASMGLAMGARFDAFTEEHVANLQATLGREVANKEKVRTERHWEQHRKMGGEINPEKLAGLEHALPTQIRFGFQSLRRAESVMVQMPPDLALAYRENIMARAGLDANDAALAQEYENWVSTGKSLHMERPVKQLDIARYNLFVANTTPDALEEEYEATKKEVQEAAKLNEQLIEAGLDPVAVPADEQRRRIEFAKRYRETKDKLKKPNVADMIRENHEKNKVKGRHSYRFRGGN